MANLGTIGISAYDNTIEAAVALLPSAFNVWQYSETRNPLMCTDAWESQNMQPFYAQKSIAGRVTLNGNPVARQVKVFHKKTGGLVGSAVSASDGNYSIKVTTSEECTVVVYDDNLNAVSMDHVFPV